MRTPPDFSCGAVGLISVLTPRACSKVRSSASISLSRL